MDPVSLEHGRFNLDGRPCFLYSGEIHYFRLAPARWAAHLRAAKAAGLDSVSSYLPWIWHEPAPGEFDFTGRTHPQRNLERWLRLVEDHGLRFIARVGPVSNAELVHEGVPGWLLRDHPEVYVRGREITNLPHTTLLAYNNPTFLRFVGNWYDAVLPRVARHAYPAGGVVMVQLCNEIGMVHWLQKAADYSGETEERFRDFLRERYAGDLARLDAAWGTRHAGWESIQQPASGDDAQPRMMLWDWMAFYQAYYADYFGELYSRYRKHGLRLPVLANIPQFYDYDVRGRGVFAPMTTMMFREFPARVPDVVFGGAYQMRRLDHENFHDIAITTEVVKLITTPGVPSVCAELQTGIMRDRPRLYPQDVELNLKLSVAHGLNGVNAYMFSGGRNTLETGAFGTYHEWQAAVGPDGRRRPHFAAIRAFGRQLRAFGTELVQTTKQPDVPIGFYAPYWTTEYLTGPDVESWEWKKHHLFYDGLARLLQLAQLNSTFVDLERAPLEDLKAHPALVVFALDFMDVATQRKLAEYVHAGGRLLLNPEVPVRDLAFRPCTVLADALGVRVTGARQRGLGLLIGGRDYLAQGSMSLLASESAQVEATSLEGEPCALRARHGRGEALVLGFGMNHMFDYQIELVRAFAASLGVRPGIDVRGELQVCLRSNEHSGFLFAANLHDLPTTARLRLTLPGELRPTWIPSRGTLAVGPRRCHILPLNVPLPGGDVLRYSTAEVLSWSARGGRLTLELAGKAGATAELEVVTSKRRARVSDGRARATRVGRRLRVGFVLTGRPQKLTIG